jgi:hypothetical protein
MEEKCLRMTWLDRCDCLCTDSAAAAGVPKCAKEHFSKRKTVIRIITRTVPSHPVLKANDIIDVFSVYPHGALGSTGQSRSPPQRGNLDNYLIFKALLHFAADLPFFTAAKILSATQLKQRQRKSPLQHAQAGLPGGAGGQLPGRAVCRTRGSRLSEF